MPTTRLRPNADWWVPYAARTGGSSINGVLSDQTDATYVRRSAGATSNVLAQVELSTFTPGSGERIVTVVPGMRYLLAATDGKPCSVAVATVKDRNAKTLYTGPYATYPKATSATDVIGHPSTGRPLAPDGTQWAQAHIDNLVHSVWDQHLATYASRAYVYELYADVFTLKPATVAISAPSGAVAGTSFPAIALSVSTVVELWQTNAPALGDYLTGGQVQVCIFDAVTYGATGFDPAVSTPVWATVVNGGVKASLLYNNDAYVDGSTPTSVALTATCGASLANGAAYRCYARASRDVPGGDVFWGAWIYSSFSIAITPPATPTTTCINAVGTVPVIYCGYSSGLTSPTFDFQRSLDGGTTWADVYDSNLQFDSTSTLRCCTDLTCPRGSSAQYRARVNCLVGGQQVSSAWSPACSLDTLGRTITNNVTGWFFYAQAGGVWSNPDQKVLAGPAIQRIEDQGVFYPRGRTKPVVVAGDMHGLDGSYDVLCANATDLANMDAIVASQGPVYVLDGFGNSKWIRITSRSKVLQGTANAPRGTWTLTYLEIDPPA